MAIFVELQEVGPDAATLVSRVVNIDHIVNFATTGEGMTAINLTGGKFLAVKETKSEILALLGQGKL